MTGTPEVSVVICTYTVRRWEALVRAVSSATAQQPAPREVLVVIDHDEELFARAGRTWADSPRVRVVANGHRTGLSGARNTGVDHAIGEIVAFLDDDAQARPGWLAALAAPYTDPTVMAVGGAAHPRWPGDRPPSLLPRELWWVVGCTYAGHPDRAGDVRNVLGASMSFRRSVFAVVGGFDESVGRTRSAPLGAEETQLCLRLRRHDATWRIVFAPDALVDHTVTPDRTRWRYLAHRSWSEGMSKAAIARTVGRSASLSTEWRYSATVLPRAVARELAGGHPVAGAAVVTSLACAAGGYLSGTVRAVRARQSSHPGKVAVGDDRAGSVGAATGTPPGPEALPRPAPSAAGDRLVSVVIPTAGRPAQVERCVRSVLSGTHRALDVVVVDNRPASPEHARVERLAELDPRVRVVAEPRPGASRARNTGFRHARSEWVLFTDDDVIVDPAWVSVLAGELATPSVDAVTGRVLPLHLGQTERLFEQYGGFSKGDQRTVFSPRSRAADPLYPYSPGIMGSGNSMGFRRCALDRLGGFDVALGPGTATKGGEDLDLFLRLGLAGGTLVYAPDALAYHEHRAAMGELRSQLRGYGAGLTATMLNLIIDEPVQLWQIGRRTRLGLRRLLHTRSERSSALGGGYPLALVAAEVAGALVGPVSLMWSRMNQPDRSRRRVPGPATLGSAVPAGGR